MIKKNRHCKIEDKLNARTFCKLQVLFSKQKSIMILKEILNKILVLVFCKWLKTKNDKCDKII